MAFQEPDSSRTDTRDSALPSHVGFIMDGNGRWARALGKPRTFGHQEGLKTVKTIVQATRDHGIPFLSLYAFSTENWKRAADEVRFLMDLVVIHLRKEYDFYRSNHIRVVHSGDMEKLPLKVQKELELVITDTASFDSLTVNLAINYGGRDEILRAFKRFASANLPAGSSHAEGLRQMSSALNEQSFSAYLDYPNIPDLDLLIRTGGEQRISNFMMWQSAYSELFFSEKMWPEYSTADLELALEFFKNRQRRFGGTS